VCKKVCISVALHFLSFRYIVTFLFISTAELHSLFLHLVCFKISDNKKKLRLSQLHSAMFHNIIITSYDKYRSIYTYQVYCYFRADGYGSFNIKRNINEVPKSLQTNAGLVL
jgi:hypothetical protein